MQGLVAIPVQQAKPLQAARSFLLVFAQAIAAFRQVQDVAADQRAFMIVGKMMDNGVIQQSAHERLLAEHAKTILPIGEFALDLDVRADPFDELTPAHRIWMPRRDDDLSVSAEKVPVQSRRHAHLQVYE